MANPTAKRPRVNAEASNDAADAQKARPRLHVSSKFDSGSIEVVDVSDPRDVKLRLVPEPYTEYDKRCHMMWFNFRVAGCKGTPLKLNIVNAGDASFPEAWPNTTARASYDQRFWFLVKTDWDPSTGTLSIEHTPEYDAVYYAYFAPYPLQDHFELVARMQSTPGCRCEVLGTTVDGHDLDMLTIGEDDSGDKRKVWIIARQHPGESMAEWFIEGFLERLLDKHDGCAIKALQKAVFYVVPNMNPDGTFRGHQRTNAKGANLNREWDNPTVEYAPEVYYTKRRMDATGCDLFIDVHGDEELPYNFTAGSEGVPSFNSRMEELQHNFQQAFLHASPDFQVGHGYEVDEPGKAEMPVGSNAVCENFKCLSFTLEMPFKDATDNPDFLVGWSPERCKNFGKSILPAIFKVLPQLR